MALSTKLQQWQAYLLDMSKRNKLLYFSLDRHPGIAFRIDVPAMLYGRLTTSRKPISVSDLPNDADPDELDEKLNRLRTRAREALNDRGTNILFLTFGLLEWREASSSDEVIRSPLVLVPVQLQRASIAAPYRLQLLENEEITINPTLREKLRRDFGIELPASLEEMDDDSDTAGESSTDRAAARLEATFDVIRQTIPQEVKNWAVKPAVYLSIFSFTKLVMYQDLEDHKALVLKHPVLRSIGGESRLAVRESSMRAEDLDDKLRPHEVVQVLDADSSQQMAIQRAKDGASFVLQGPPGTGKSQTIANIVAECLGQGKRVLFVSEKMAALEVVQQRLKDVGLGDYCLDLHSHRSDKKVLLEELRQCLDEAGSPRRANAAADWERQSGRLFESRQELNGYVRALHAKRTRLERSAFEIYGVLARLHDVPDLDCTLPDPITMTQAQLDAFERLLSDFLTRGDVLVDQAVHPWRATRLETFTEAVAANIKSHFERCAALLRQTHDAVSTLDNVLGGADLAHTQDGALRGLALADVAVRTQLPEAAWLTTSDLAGLRHSAAETAARAGRHEERHAQLTTLYDPQAIELDPEPISEALTSASATAIGRLQCEGTGPMADPHDVALACADALEEHLVHAAEVLERMTMDAAQVAQILEQVAPTTPQAIADLADLAAHIVATPQPPLRWLNRDEFAVAQVAMIDAAERYRRVSLVGTELMRRYQPSMLQLNLKLLDDQFSTRYRSMLRIVHPGFWRQIQDARACLQPKVNRTAREIVADVHQARALVDEESFLRDQRVVHASALGTHFAAHQTNWAAVHSALAWTGQLHQLLSGERPNQRMEALITGNTSKLQPLRARLQRLHASVEEWRAEQAYLEDTLLLDELPGDAFTLDEADAGALREWLLALVDMLRPYWAAARTLASLRPTLPELAARRWAELLDDIRLIRELRASRAWFQVHESQLRETLGSFYDGLETDWTAINQALAWCDELRSTWGGNPIPASLVIVLSREGDERARMKLMAARDQTRHLMESLRAEWAFYETVLPLEALAPADGTPFAATPLTELADRLMILVHELPRLEQWTDFRRYWKACELNGLGSFVDAVTRQIPVPTNLLDLFHKRLYQLWLDAIYRDVPVLGRFRGTTHEQTIERFRQLDEEHIALARKRLAASLATMRTSAIASAASTDDGEWRATGAGPAAGTFSRQLSYLRREIGKKRHPSIRQIIQSAGLAVVALKPCWMMSPLSASQFVVPGAVEFDLVVFDEASQICPEDAICSILRGKQLIVVGDPKQLPPTRFFAKSVSDSITEDGDIEEELFESILDECSPVMPAYSLLWHYRSQHESLIAFSNHHFYDDRLYTFPGPQTEHREGVGFEYVENGQYDRSRSRTNPIEAARVADLVIEHFDWHPERSLGVVALSEAQQSAIDHELALRRRSRPDLESFFDENALSPFFVKNLESVQGDERDVIILSVGYGKDATGRLYQNFGPINGAGGGRRLNVAVTRARHQVIVVSSIRADELNVSSARSSGARLLHAYLDYAEHGPRTLGEQGPVVTEGDDATPTFDSPFEEDVYQALIACGLTVATQVGCSGYRIDLAIRDPHRPDRYVLGVECDGATYHSSHTARDRDRLRQQHLERLGWQIHRIWSRDWIRDREHEIQKVMDRLAMLREQSPAPVAALKGALTPATPPARTTGTSTAAQPVRLTSVAPAYTPPPRAAESVPVQALNTGTHTCETCTHFMAKTSTAFLCLHDATIKRRDPNGQTPGCPGWKRLQARATQ